MVKKNMFVCIRDKIFVLLLREKNAHTPGNEPSLFMKKERISFFVLFVEIAAIILLHSAKNHHAEGNKLFSDKKTAANSAYQLKALTITEVK
jgi:hypothetical protein